jgi:hypothetical protein
MPYKSKKQRRYFLACEHGYEPPGGKKCPPQSVIDEFEGKRVEKACKRKRMKKMLPLD